MKVGWLYRIGIAFRQIFKNKFRFLLTLSGLSLSILLFLGSYLFLDSLYFSKFNDIGFWKENDLLSLEMTTDARSFEADKQKMIRLFGNEYLTFQWENNSVLKCPVTVGDTQVYVNLSMYRTNSNFSGNLILENGMVEVSNLREGNGISEKNIKEEEYVIIIGSTVAEILFDGGSAIGKTIRVPYLTEGYQEGNVVSFVEKFREFTVVGVYEDTDEKRNELLDAEGEFVSFVTNAYIPYSVRLKDKDNEDMHNAAYYLYAGKGHEGKNIEELLLSAGAVGYYRTYDSLYQEIEQQYSGIRTTMNIVTVVILIMSAFMISQTMVFSVKERISEFGIKRALGASGEAIAFDLVMEAVIYSVIAFLTALVVAVFGVLVALNIATAKEIISGITFHMQLRSVLIGAVMSLFTCLVAVIFPLGYLDRKSIVETIRFE